MEGGNRKSVKTCVHSGGSPGFEIKAISYDRTCRLFDGNETIWQNPDVKA